MKLPEFKMGFTFSGKYRKDYIRPMCEALLKLGFHKNDIFYDEWHEELINGTRGDEILKEIYRHHCELVVVLLSPDYKERNWPGNIEWRSVKELINEGKDDKICLLGIDSVDIDKIDGLYKHQAIPKYIDSTPSAEVAKFIVRVYRQRFDSDDIDVGSGTQTIYRSGDLKKPSQISRTNSRPGHIDRVMGCDDKAGVDGVF